MEHPADVHYFRELDRAERIESAIESTGARLMEELLYTGSDDASDDDVMYALNVAAMRRAYSLMKAGLKDDALAAFADAFRDACAKVADEEAKKIVLGVADMRYVNQFRNVNELAAALLTAEGAFIPSHRGDGPSAIFYRERRVNLDDVLERLTDRRPYELRLALEMAGRDATDAGHILSRARTAVALELARELAADWMEDAA